MSCLDVDKLNPAIFNDVCVASDFLQNGTAFVIVQAALKTCCGSNNVFTTDDDCYTYCNITTPFDTVMLNNCLLDTLDPDTSDSIDYDCFPFAWELSSTTDTRAGRIATTWTYPDQTLTVTETNGAVKTETLNYWGDNLTGTAASPGFTATKATGTAEMTSPPSTDTAKTTSPPTTSAKSASGATTPTSSKSSGGSGLKLHLQTGILVGLVVVAFVL